MCVRAHVCVLARIRIVGNGPARLCDMSVSAGMGTGCYHVSADRLRDESQCRPDCITSPQIRGAKRDVMCYVEGVVLLGQRGVTREGGWGVRYTGLLFGRREGCLHSLESFLPLVVLTASPLTRTQPGNSTEMRKSLHHSNQNVHKCSLSSQSRGSTVAA